MSVEMHQHDKTSATDVIHSYMENADIKNLCGNMFFIQALIKANAYMTDIVIDQCGNNMLHLASRYRHKDVVEKLIKAGVDVNVSNYKYKYTALHIASLHGHIDIVETLLSAGADIYKQGEIGETALHDAASEGHIDVVDALIEADVVMKRDNVSLIDVKNNYGNTALYNASHIGCDEIIQRLVAAGANVNEKNYCKDTALHIASRNGRIDTVRLLITLGADVDAKDDYGNTAFNEAWSRRHYEVTEILDRS